MLDKERVSAAAKEAIESAFQGLHGQGAGSRKWTKIIKEKLCAAGKSEGLKTAAAGVSNAKWGEWLYDVCWLRYAKPHSSRRHLVDKKLDYLTEVALIVESEWGDLGDIRDDFHKLLVGRATVRCMIWDDRQGKSRDIANWLAEMVCEFSRSQPDDLYLLAGYKDDGFQFWRMNGDGNLNGPDTPLIERP